ncbi:MAG: CoA transferase subunit A [Sulfobacillus sp.]
MSKLLSAQAMMAQIPDGASVTIGGSSLSRKPMALVRALARSGRKNLTLIVNVGGPEVDLLIGLGVVSKVIYAFVGFEVLGLAPHFRAARQTQQVEFEEWTEYTVMAGLDAAIKRVPFLPTRAGLGTDVLHVNTSFRTIEDPFSSQTLVAVPAIHPDFALLHVNYADDRGNGVILGDGHIDVLCAKAARTTFMSCERVLNGEELQKFGRDVQVLRIHTQGVTEIAWGAHPTGCAPEYRADLKHLEEYIAATGDAARWNAYKDNMVWAEHNQYLDRVGGREHLVSRLHV